MIRIWIAMMLALLLLAGCGGEKDAGYVARKLDIVLPQPAAVTSGDSHGGFHGDGLLHMELTFSQEDALAVEEAVSSAGWSLFPMEPELEERLYPDGAGASDWPDWPVPARGWWYLEDRQEDETEDMCGSGTLTTIPLRSMTQIPASCTTRSWTPETGGMSEWTI